MKNRIKEQRKKNGITQEELGNKLGLGKSAIAKYEKGRVENIKKSTVEKMAEILQCHPSYLMGLNDDCLLKNHCNEPIREIINIALQLNDKDQWKLVGKAEIMLDSDKYQKKIT